MKEDLATLGQCASSCRTEDAAKGQIPCEGSCESNLFESSQVHDKPIEENALEASFDAFIEATKTMDAVPFDDIEATSGAPLETLYIEIDSLSQVSNMTPLSSNGISCMPVRSIGGSGDHSTTSKMEELSSAMDAAATFVFETMSAVMEDMVDSIDPTVLEECQDRTRSMLSKSWGVAFQPPKHRRFPRVPSSVFTSESNQNRGDPHLAAADSEANHDECQRTHQIDHKWCASTSSSPAQKFPIENFDNVGVELTQDGAVIEYGSLGEEVEISMNGNHLLFDCRDMTTEVRSSPTQVVAELDSIGDDSREMENSMGASAGIDIYKKSGGPRLQNIKHYFKVQTTKQQSNLLGPERLKLPRPMQPPLHTNVSKISRGSGKTVSTVFSDESTMHTAEPGWIQDRDIINILQG